MIGHEQLDAWVLDLSVRERLLEPDGSIVIVHQSQLRCAAQEVLTHSVLNEVSSVGLMLPTSMLHNAIVENVGPVVVTSANLDGEPMCVEASEVETLTREVVGMSIPLIDHNRPIYNRVDDSVVLARTNGFMTVRPGRGLTPQSWNLNKAGLELNLHARNTQVLGLGAQQKVCFAWSDGAQVTLGPYIGDLASVAMQSAAIMQWEHLSTLTWGKPTVVVHDEHPDFFTTHWARSLETEKGIRRHSVQHHRAHWLASLLEPGWLGRTAIGIVWDGTGLGEGGKVWGGEAFVGDCWRQDRVATLHTFGLPGGEAAIREPWRVAISLLSQVNWNYAEKLFDGLPIGALRTMLAQNLNVAPTSSMGRLFDGVAAMILDSRIGRRVVSYEGELAQLLEECCDENETGCYLIPLINADKETEGIKYVWDWRPMIARIAEEKVAEVSTGKIAMRFHRALANAICELLRLYPELPLTLSGGCFQNRVLLSLLQEANVEAIRAVAWPGIVPVNDSAIALGQVIAGLVEEMTKDEQGKWMTEATGKCV
jgi:hydrogenase maturation protein HypF